MNLSVKLTSGGSIHLDGLLMLDTYRGFLEGEMAFGNSLVRSRYLDMGKELWPDLPRHCINEASIEMWAAFRFPKTQGSAMFLSYNPARDKAKHFSALNVIWFQDEICPTLSPSNLSLLQNLDWEKYASDFEW